MREVLIVLILKPHKDLLRCDYRPIYLINVDVKILVKVLANRLNTVIAQLVRGKQEWINAYKVH